MLAMGAASSFQIPTAIAQDTDYTLLTITNPVAEASDCFGRSVAALGTNRLLIGSPNDNTGASAAGTAYLFTDRGVLLTTFTNPTPAFSDYFGDSVAAVGNDRVLIGAYGAHEAYLFSTSGVLLTTFTNPIPEADDNFGRSVSEVGADLVLIGAPGYNMAPTWGVGRAYLFNTNGMLLTTYANPKPAHDANFGCSVTALGSDRLLIGANGGIGQDGAAFLFSTNGALLTTFTNPTPGALDQFGAALAAVGADRVVIGASYDSADDSTNTIFVGAAYLFNTNGLLLTVFTNPTPTSADHFGQCVAAAGSDRVMIGAYGDSTSVSNAGAVYLFSTNGNLLTTFTNPSPAKWDYFGYSLAAVATGPVLIGAYGDNTGADDGGTVYLFSATVPTLTIRLTTTNMIAVSWPSPSTGWMLQQNTNSISSVNWSNAPSTIQDDGTTKTLIVSPPSGNRFYRLFKP